MARKTPEGIVLEACIKELKQWQSVGVVIYWQRMNVRTWNDGRHIKLADSGASDLIAYVKNNKLLYVYLIECKRPIGGKVSENQLSFKHRFDGISNVIYEIVTDSKQIYRTIENITKHYQNQLDLITIPQ